MNYRIKDPKTTTFEIGDFQIIDTIPDNDLGQTTFILENDLQDQQEVTFEDREIYLMCRQLKVRSKPQNAPVGVVEQLIKRHRVYDNFYKAINN